MSDHAKLSPSAAKRWKVCPASVQESTDCPRTDSVDSLKGTAGHWVFSEMLNGRTVEAGTKAPNGVEVTVEMLELVGEAFGWVQKYLTENPGCHVASEEQVQIGSYFDLSPEVLWGTCDLRIMAKTELVVFDLKLGWVDVQAEDNDQLALYAGGLAEELGWLWDSYRLVIHQPKNGGAKEWVITREELQAKLEEFREPIANALSPEPRYNPAGVDGWSPCTDGYCPAVAKCAVLHAEQVALAKREFDFVVQDGDAITVAPHVTVEQVAEVLQKADFIESALKAMRQHALRLIQLGQDVPGFKAVEGKRNRVWKPGAEVEVVAALGDKAYTKKLISPAQAEKMLSVGTFEKLWEKPKGEPKLAPVTDKRPALAPHFDMVDLSDLLE